MDWPELRELATYDGIEAQEWVHLHSDMPGQKHLRRDGIRLPIRFMSSEAPLNAGMLLGFSIRPRTAFFQKHIGVRVDFRLESVRSVWITEDTDSENRLQLTVFLKTGVYFSIDFSKKGKVLSVETNLVPIDEVKRPG